MKKKARNEEKLIKTKQEKEDEKSNFPEWNDEMFFQT